MVDPDVAIDSLLPTRPPLSLREREDLVNVRYQHRPQVVGGECRSTNRRYGATNS